MFVFSATGNWGERAATKHLRRNGYNILERNWRTQFAEIDIIAEKGGTLVIVEVKQRKWTTFGTAGQAVDNRKQRKIKAAAQLYIMKKNIRRNVRFDVIEVKGEKGAIFSKCTINHIENAF